jgi:hypothetical protein
VDFARHYPGIDPGNLWRARDWRRLLNLIDHLPQNSYYYQALANDEEHARAIAEWRAAHHDPDQKKAKPGWQGWSPEVDKLASIENELRLLRSTLVSVNGGTLKFEPVDRPESAIEEAIKKAEYRRKLSVHERLKAKLLPGKRD